MDRKQLKRNLYIGGTIVVVAGVVILEKGRVDKLVKAAATQGLIAAAEASEAIQEAADEAFENGIKYGLRLAKGLEASKEIGREVATNPAYAFSAFDKH